MKKTGLIVLLSGLLLAGCAEEKTPVFDESSALTQTVTESDALTETKPIPDREFTVVCLGDSITEGMFELIRSDFGYGYNREPENAYPAKMEALLTDIGYRVEVINAGISGDTVGKGIKRLEEDVFAHSPDIVTVCFGLNDVCSGDEAYFEEQLNALFDLLEQNLPEAEVIFMTPNMMATYIHEDTADDPLNYNMALTNVYMMNSGELDLFVETAKTVCAGRDIPVCDAYARWKEMYAAGTDVTQMLCSYVTHPNREMQTLFAELLAPCVEEAMQKSE